MTEREFEQRLRAWYRAKVGETEAAPADLRRVLATIPATTPIRSVPAAGEGLHVAGRRRGPGRRRRAGRRFRGHHSAAGGDARARTSRSSGRRDRRHPADSGTDRRTSGRRIDRLHATRREGAHVLAAATSVRPSRVWIVEQTGAAPTSCFPDGNTNQAALVWSPDGTRLLYSDDESSTWSIRAAAAAQPMDTGCAAPCVGDSQVALLPRRTRLVFVRESTDPCTGTAPAAIATMDLESGQVVELASTGSDGVQPPAGPPTGPRSSSSGSAEGRWRSRRPRLDAIWVVDAGGENLQQLSPTTSPPRIPNGPRMAPGSCSSHRPGSTRTSTRSVPTEPTCVG